MTKGSYLAILVLLIGSSLMLPASSQEQVSQTVYVYDGDFNGSLLSGVQVAGQDAAGKSFNGITDSNGVAVVSGQPGTWLFVFIKDGYETLDLSYNVTETDEGDVYLVRSNQLTEQIAPYLNNQQPEAISEANTAYQMQLAANATPLVETKLDPDQVSQTVYVYDGDFNGALLSGVQVAGQDAAGRSFGGITDSNGVAVVSGQPGTWLFGFTKDGYETLKLSYNITETGEGAVYLVRSEEAQEQIALSPNNQQPEIISESNATDVNEPETASAEYWLEKGNFLYEQGRYDEADASYDRCILLNPQLEAAWFNKGNALYMQGNYDNALLAFDKAIEISPQDANAWICRGLTLKKLDRNLEANTALMQAKGLGYTG